MSTVHYGIHGPLEQAANELIFGALRGVTSQAEKSDILTPWKEQNRRNREVLTSDGTPPDARIRRGMFHRARNDTRPHLNGREGIAPAIRDVIMQTGTAYSGTNTGTFSDGSTEEF